VWLLLDALGTGYFSLVELGKDASPNALALGLVLTVVWALAALALRCRGAFSTLAADISGPGLQDQRIPRLERTESADWILRNRKQLRQRCGSRAIALGPAAASVL